MERNDSSHSDVHVERRYQICREVIHSPVPTTERKFSLRISESGHKTARIWKVFGKPTECRLPRLQAGIACLVELKRDRSTVSSVGRSGETVIGSFPRSSGIPSRMHRDYRSIPPRIQLCTRAAVRRSSSLLSPRRHAVHIQSPGQDPVA